MGWVLLVAVSPHLLILILILLSVFFFFFFWADLRGKIFFSDLQVYVCLFGGLDSGAGAA